MRGWSARKAGDQLACSSQSFGVARVRADHLLDERQRWKAVRWLAVAVDELARGGRGRSCVMPARQQQENEAQHHIDIWDDRVEQRRAARLDVRHHEIGDDEQGEGLARREADLDVEQAR